MKFNGNIALCLIYFIFAIILGLKAIFYESILSWIGFFGYGIISLMFLLFNDIGTIKKKLEEKNGKKSKR